MQNKWSVGLNIYMNSSIIKTVMVTYSTNISKTNDYLSPKIIEQKNSMIYKGNNKITELRTILQRESQNS